MAILGPHASGVHDPFCDYLDVTLPVEHADEVRHLLFPLLASVGSETRDDGELWHVPHLRKCAGGVEANPGLVGLRPGTVKASRFGAVFRVSASGGVLSTLRAAGLYLHYLSVIGEFSHRVTRLDATLDLPVHAPPRVLALDAETTARGFSLGRKAVPPNQCSAWLGADRRGERTGLVYVGRRAKREICATVYDKRHQLETRDCPDPGPTLRVELSFSGQVGCTLRDAAAPGALFWWYARGLLDAPAGAPVWDRAGEGFHLDRPPPLDPVVAITRACERSPGLRTLIALSDRLGITRAHLWGYMNHAHPLRPLAAA